MTGASQSVNTAEKPVTMRGISGSTLKIFAVTAMFLDHFAWVIIDPEVKEIFSVSYPAFISPGDLSLSPFLAVSSFVFHSLGRMAFPIFLFLLSEGIAHTRNVYRYGLRLLILAVVSEVPFDITFFGDICYPGRQNVFFTLLLAYIAMTAISKCTKKLVVPVIIIIAACALGAYFLKTDYSFRGVLMGCIFELVRRVKKLSPRIGNAVSSALACIFEIIFKPFYFTAILSVTLISLYNGKRGLKLKYFFYLFYPAHLILIYLIKILLQRAV